MYDTSPSREVQAPRRRGRPRTSLRSETVIRWSAQDRNRLYHLKNRPEYSSLSWEEFQQLNFFPGRTWLALSMAYARVEKRVMRGRSVICDNPLKRFSQPPDGSSPDRQNKRPKLENADDTELDETSGGEDGTEDEDGSEYEDLTSGDDAAQATEPDATGKPSAEKDERTSKRHSWHAAPSNTIGPQQPAHARTSTGPSPRHTSHVSWDPAISQDTSATVAVEPSSSAATSEKHRAIPEKGPAPQPTSTPRQPSVPSSTTLPDQFFTHAIQNLIQCAHALAQHKTYLMEMKAQQDAETALIKHQLEAAQFKTEKICEALKEGSEEMMPGLRSLEERVASLKERSEAMMDNLQSLEERLSLLEQPSPEFHEMKQNVDKIASLVEQPTAALTELANQVNQIETRVKVLDGLENLSALDMLRGWLGPKDK